MRLSVGIGNLKLCLVLSIVRNITTRKDSNVFKFSSITLVLNVINTYLDISIYDDDDDNDDDDNDDNDDNNCTSFI